MLRKVRHEWGNPGENVEALPVAPWTALDAGTMREIVRCYNGNEGVVEYDRMVAGQ